MAKELTSKQQRFIEEYLVDLNATQAAIRAGYAKGTANREGSRLLSNVDIQAAIELAMAKRSERVDVDADYVVTELRKVVETDSTPAAARVTALTVLARHLKMLTDKVETKEIVPRVKIIYLPVPGHEYDHLDDSKSTQPIESGQEESSVDAGDPGISTSHSGFYSSGDHRNLAL